MKNWKTTTLGVLIILSAVINAAINWLKTGTFPDLATLSAAFTGGGALLWARDPEKPSGPAGGTTPVVILALCASVGLSGCAWVQAHKTQIKAVAGVALEHLGKDVAAIAASALVNQAKSGFSEDWADSLAQGAYTLTPEIISSGNLQDYLDAWNPAAPEVNKAIAAKVSTALPGNQVVAALKDEASAKALASSVGVTIGNAVLNETGQSAAK